jgi:hypothetical protein
VDKNFLWVKRPKLNAEFSPPSDAVWRMPPFRPCTGMSWGEIYFLKPYTSAKN